MNQTAIRRSPIQPWLEAQGAEYRTVGEVSLAVRLQSLEAERSAADSLAICDLSGLPKLGLKGRGAADWLQGQQVSVPASVFDSLGLPGGGLIVRFGKAEFFLEEGLAGDLVASLSTALVPSGGYFFRVEHQEATLLLVGSRAEQVLAQTCSIDFGDAPARRVLLTRVAGVSCGLLPDEVGSRRAYRLWVDYSYAQYLWEALVEICESLGGQAVGCGCLYPEVLS